MSLWMSANEKGRPAGCSILLAGWRASCRLFSLLGGLFFGLALPTATTPHILSHRFWCASPLPSDLSPFELTGNQQVIHHRGTHIEKNLYLSNSKCFFHSRPHMR